MRVPVPQDVGDPFGRVVPGDNIDPLPACIWRRQGSHVRERHVADVHEREDGCRGRETVPQLPLDHVSDEVIRGIHYLEAREPPLDRPERVRAVDDRQLEIRLLLGHEGPRCLLGEYLEPS